MPPFVSRKRRASTPPAQPVQAQRAAGQRKGNKPSLFDTLDSRPKSARTLEDNKAFLNGLEESDSSSPLSEISSSDFEDVLSSHPSKRRKIEAAKSDDDEDDEEMEWEDAIAPELSAPLRSSAEPSGALEFTLDKNAHNRSAASLHGPKKGPSKIERQIRLQTHCMHVQFLLFHNLVRNAWICDEEVHKILVGQLTPGIKKEFQRWKEASGMTEESENEPSKTRNGKSIAQKVKVAAAQERNQRDWGYKAERLENGAPNLSRGDPLIRLMKILSAFWKKKFRITAPGLRKRGYKSLPVLETEVAALKKGKLSPEECGERVDNIEDFREHAKRCEGSRDLGAQLFAALLRGLGLEARMVTNLQPIGFGWSKGEDATTKKKGKAVDDGGDISHAPQPSADESAASQDEIATKNLSSRHKSKPNTTKTSAPRRKTENHKNVATVLSDDSSALSNLSDDDRSVVDITPGKRPTKSYDKDLPFPIYWTEVLSTISNKYVPVDPLILPQPVAMSPDILATFEPRGAKADKAKQVLAYVVAFSADGTSKDVTVRYLKRHMWPGKTKGMRIPVEKVPVYNKRGKVKRYEDYDWFKNVISGYSRSSKQRTAVDNLEDEDDLKPTKLVRKTEHKEDTLQGYKASAEFVLERHLRREEALRPGATPVKTFTTGKGDKARQEDVYRREDVAICRTSESWHKEGREVLPGQQPIKMVPVRAVTLTRKREVEEAEREGGEKLKQGMYSIEQTDWIIPPPIQNGVIPKNAYGNIDCFVPTLVPEGPVHIPQRGTAKICKRLNIDFAEAVTGFEFGKQRAVPVINGVVVAEGNEDMVIEAWEIDEEEKRKKEEGKREKVALALWRKFLMGLRIVQRVREDYGGDKDAHIADEINPFTRTKSNKKREANLNANDKASRIPALNDEGDDMAGGFLPEDHDNAVDPVGVSLDDHVADDDGNAGGFLLDEANDEDASRMTKPLIPDSYPQTPVSLSSVHQKNRPSTSEADHSDDDASSNNLETQKKSKKTAKSAVSKAAIVRKTPTEKNSSRGDAAKPKGRVPHTRANPKTATTQSNDKSSSDLSDSGSSASEEPKQAKHPSRATKASKATPKRKATKKSSTATRSFYFDTSGSDEQSDSEPSSPDEPVSAKTGSRTTTSTPRAAPKRKAAKKALNSDRSIYFMSGSSDAVGEDGYEEDSVGDSGEDKKVPIARAKGSKKAKNNVAAIKTGGLRRSTRKTM